MKATLKTINTYLHKWAPQIELVKGKGYFYFADTTERFTNLPTSIYVYAICRLTQKQWEKEMDASIAIFKIENRDLDWPENIHNPKTHRFGYVKFDHPFTVVCLAAGWKIIAERFSTKRAAIKFANIQTGGLPTIWETYRREDWLEEKFRRVRNWRKEGN